MILAVTGKEGQLVQSLLERAELHGVTVVRVGRPEADLEAPETVRAALAAARPDVIVSAAAYTAVDKAESEPERAFAINEGGAAAAASAARDLGVPLIHISTDYVFDGAKDTPWTEEDEPAPLGVYGASKLAGEVAVSALWPNSVILRTAWVHSPFGANFVRTMLRLAGSRDEVSVVADQIGNPTSALSLAEGLISVARNLAGNDDPGLRGVFHMVAAGEASRADLSEAVFALSASAGGPSARVRRISTAEDPTPARRPANSRLDCTKLADRHHVRLAPWRDTLEATISRLVTGHQMPSGKETGERT